MQSYELDLQELFGSQRTESRAALAATMRELLDGSLRSVDVDALGPGDSAMFEPRVWCQLSAPELYDELSLDDVLAGYLTEGGRDGVARIPGTSVELVESADPIVEGFLRTNAEPATALRMVVPTATQVADLATAFELVRLVTPSLHRMLVESVRTVVLYQHPSAESFAALSLHGAVLLNLPSEDPGVCYFANELAHQGGHVIFSEATLDRAAFLAVDPDLSIAEAVGGTDGRDVYGFFHGIFTECMETLVCSRVAETARDHALDFRAHLDAVMPRFERDLAIADEHPQIFTDAGAELVQEFRRVYQAAAAERESASA